MTQSGLHDYVFDARRAGTSDLHITAGLPSMIRGMIYGILTDDQCRRLENDWELDFSYSLPRTAYFRVNVCFQRGFLGADFRTILDEIKSFKGLGQPTTGPCRWSRRLRQIHHARRNDRRNAPRAHHECRGPDRVFAYSRNLHCQPVRGQLGHQELLPSAQARFEAGSRRHFVGQMRGLEIISLAVTAAEPDHLVFANAALPRRLAGDRPYHRRLPHQQQHRVRAQLAKPLQRIATQALMPRRDDGEGRVVACEIPVSPRR